MSGRRCRAALIVFTVMSLAGCSLVEQVIVIEDRKEAGKPSATQSRRVSIASRELKCAQNVGGPGCSGEVLSKANSARYDSGPVLKPLKKPQENKPAEVRENSAFVSAVKGWLKTGMRLPGWAGHK